MHSYQPLTLLLKKMSEGIIDMCLRLCIYLNLGLTPSESPTRSWKRRQSFSFIFLLEPLRSNIPVAIAHNLNTPKATTLRQKITYYTCARCL